jgi:hypothetical protein
MKILLAVSILALLSTSAIADQQRICWNPSDALQVCETLNSDGTIAVDNSTLPSVNLESLASGETEFDMYSEATASYGATNVVTGRASGASAKASASGKATKASKAPKLSKGSTAKAATVKATKIPVVKIPKVTMGKMTATKVTTKAIGHASPVLTFRKTIRHF